MYCMDLIHSWVLVEIIINSVRTYIFGYNSVYLTYQYVTTWHCHSGECYTSRIRNMSEILRTSTQFHSYGGFLSHRATPIVKSSISNGGIFPDINQPFLDTIHFSGIFPYKPTIFGYPHWWQPPYCDIDLTIPELSGGVEKAGKIRPELEPQKAAKIHDLYGEQKAYLSINGGFNGEKNYVYIYIYIILLEHVCFHAINWDPV